MLLPELARALKAGNLVEAANLQNRSVEFTLFLTLPAAAALLVMSEPIVRVLYERGAFAATNGTPTVSAVLAIFGLGLPAFVLIKAFTPGYFAREDTRTPMYFAADLGAGQRVGRADAVPVDRRAPASPPPRRSPAGSMRLLLLGVLIRRGHWGRDVGAADPHSAAAGRSGGDGRMRSTSRIRWFATELASGSPLYVQAVDARGSRRAVAAVIYFAVAFGIGGADLGMIRRSVRRGAAKPDPDLPASD